MDTNVIENAADGAKDHRWRRRINWLVAVIVVSVCALAVWGMFQYAQSQELAQKQSDAADIAKTLFDQVQQLGGTPKVSPPAPVTGAQGPAGASGSSGPEGPSGPPGPQGSPGATGPTGPTGPTGVDGATGQPGSNGTDGKDGATGAPGPSGAAGPPGAPGANGSPAQTETYSYPDGSVWTCTRQSGSPDTSPTYACTETTKPTPTKTTGLLPAVRTRK